MLQTSQRPLADKNCRQHGRMYIGGPDGCLVIVRQTFVKWCLRGFSPPILAGMDLGNDLRASPTQLDIAAANPSPLVDG